jgi:two-component system, chemotaxis family, chemotaxis protein CheY
MFTKPELQVIAKILLQRREWLNKSIHDPEQATTKIQNQETLNIIDNILTKLGLKPKVTPAPQETAPSPSNKPTKSAAALKHSQMKPEDIKALIVDDDNLIVMLLQTILTSAGIKKVDTTEDGLKAISMLYDANPVYDLVLCDWNMPIKNGLDVHNAMRAAERYIDTCFMLVTAVTEAKQIRAAIDEGVDDYAVKPIEEQKIIKKIARHFPLVGVANNS